MEARRKRVVVLGAVVACMAGPCAMFAQRFPRFVWVWLGMMAAMLMYAGMEFARWKRKDL